MVNPEETLKNLAKPENEGDAFAFVQKLRERFENGYEGLLSKVLITSHEEAISRAIRTIEAIMVKVMAMNTVNVDDIDAGHSVGHWVRDYIHAAVILASKASGLGILPNELYIGIVGGALHEVGCLFVPRYEETTRAVRHAEIGGIMVYLVGEEIGLIDEERILLFYAISAHTHYLKESEVTCKDGVTRTIIPYMDKTGDEQPIMMVFFPRWCDRCDLRGPAYIWRHFLTLVKETLHMESGSNEFYVVNYLAQMMIRCDEKSVGDKTMMEHWLMFAAPKSLDNAYSKFDEGIVDATLSEYREITLRIIQAVLDGKKEKINLSVGDQTLILEAFTVFLYTNIEPTKKGEEAAGKLKDMFDTLDRATKNAWLNGFLVGMKEYLAWAEKIMDHEVSPITGLDAKAVITPDSRWVKAVKVLSN